MNIFLDRDNNRICVPVASLAYFARTRRSASRLSFAQLETEDECVAPGRELSLSVNEEGFEFTVVGKADSVFGTGDSRTVEIYEERRRISSRTTPISDPAFMAKGVMTAHMMCCSEGLSGIRLRLTYMADGTARVKTFESYISSEFLANMASALIQRATPFIVIQADKLLCGFPGLANMPFPYKSVRGAQKDFIYDTYRAVKGGSRLIVSAPTGVGKTVSALYPALRAIGRGLADKVFYLTAKTVTGIASADAIRTMSAQVPSLKCVTVIAKERLCSMSNLAGTTRHGKCRVCPLLGEVNRIPYEERRDSALLELLDNYRVIDPATLQAVAKKYELCAYELSLDVSEYCEAVICDYNYAFDPSVRFKRYFTEGQGRYVFLVDEAHNLPDRAREMYSATFDAATFLKLYKMGAEVLGADKPLIDGIGAVIEKIKEITVLCKSEEHIEGGKSAGYYISSQMLSGLPEALTQFARGARGFESDDEQATAAVEEGVSAAVDFVRSAMLFDKGFVLYCEMFGGKLRISSRCLDPSGMLNNMMCAAKSSVLFSATLTPMDYFADVLGCRDAALLELDSPYDPANLCIFAYDSISTRYSDREGYYDEVAEVIMSVCEAKAGNYMVYFPSYEYMSEVADIFAEMSPDIKCVVQSRGMSHKDRQRFLDEFSKRHEDFDTLVGFAVLGGVFAEGVDLRGEKLIGTVIVGTGLPKMCAELNILSEFFEKTRESGHDYAYTYLAMIKVQQAAGRVIRSETDRGVVVLVDDRYAQPATYRLFPKAWRHIKYTGDPYSLNAALCRFWKNE